MKKIEQIKGSIFCTCTACMSVWADFLSWANAHPARMYKSPEEADNIILLGCQVTDLAVYNDLKVLSKYMRVFPTKKFFVGGCLSQRLDIPLPEGVKRLDHTRKDYTIILDKRLVRFEKPFWVPELNESSEYSDGMLFRNMYPLRIGVGCSGKCTYCTIKHTRGESYQLTVEGCKEEFRYSDDPVLIADSPTAKQLTDWCVMAQIMKKPISIRNVEPQVAMAVWDTLKLIAKQGFLKVFHCPIQSGSSEILKAVHRDWVATMNFISRTKELRLYGTKVATNIIIDIEGFPKSSLKKQMKLLKKHFDYISWNPMWMGTYDPEKAEERFKKYIKG